MTAGEHDPDQDEERGDAPKQTGGERCPECDGTGRVNGRECPACEGSGNVMRGLGGG